MSWQERGGPPVIEPAHCGFGSTIIERMIARSLLGSAKVTYAPGGTDLGDRGPGIRIDRDQRVRRRLTAFLFDGHGA
jgi:hypothetical protein